MSDRSRRSGELRPLRDVVTGMVARRSARATENQRDVQRNFLDVVAQWSAGEITTRQARTLTGDGYLRAMALSITTPQHEQYKDAMRMIDAIIASHDPRDRRLQGVYTNRGWFATGDVEDAGGRFIDRVDAVSGEIVRTIQFPVVTDDGTVIWPVQRSARPAPEDDRFRSPFADDWIAPDTPGEDSTT